MKGKGEQRKNRKSNNKMKNIKFLEYCSPDHGVGGKMLCSTCLWEAPSALCIKASTVIYIGWPLY